jgi:hypothetical protein
MTQLTFHLESDQDEALHLCKIMQRRPPIPLSAALMLPTSVCKHHMHAFKGNAYALSFNVSATRIPLPGSPRGFRVRQGFYEFPNIFYEDVYTIDLTVETLEDQNHAE